MKKYKISAWTLLISSYLLFVVLIALIFLLPKGAFWYTEIKKRPDTLPTVLISTCYPCVPFAFLAIWEIRKVAKNIINDRIFIKENQKSLFLFGLCCLIAGAIMFVAGFFYFPFFITSGAALFCTLMTKVFYDVFSIHVVKEDESDTPEYEEIEEPKKNEDPANAEETASEKEED
ncbi:MAG: DUF2975 domain-containing protein [Clostridia bacterium]|nr:DUF2975 domain-containing protein [Clostridia bacterium]